MMKKLLELRKKIKSKSPKKFSRKDSHKKVRIGDKWRKPKGLQNKMRLHLKSHKVIVKPGYRTPVLTRDLNQDGLKIVNISSLKQLELINSKEESIMISSKVSVKTKLGLINACITKKIVVENVKDLSKETEKINSDFENKKKSKQKTISSRKTKKESVAKKTEKKTEKKKSEVKEDDKAKKDAVKKEQDKILTSKV